MNSVKEVQNNNDVEAQIASLLADAAVADIENKHFRPGYGSCFESVKSLEELLRVAARQRTNQLSDDDKNELVGLGATADAFIPGCRYLKIETKGRVGVLPISEVADDEPIFLIVGQKESNDAKRMNRQPIPSLFVDRAQLPTTDVATIIIGPADEEDSSKGETIWTAHPGLPIKPATGNIPGWSDGGQLTMTEVMEKLGPNAFVQVRIKTL